jgi:hypothetical protein
VLGEFDPLFALPAPEVGRHSLVREVARDLVVVGFDGKRFTTQPRRDRIGIAIKANGKIGMHLGWGGITAIRSPLR